MSGLTIAGTFERGRGRDLIESIGRGILILMPPLFVVGQAAADAALTTVAILFLVRSLVERDWRWLEEPWVLTGLVVWIYLMLNALYAAYDTAAATSRAAPFGRFVVFAAALQFWLFVEPSVRRWFVRVLALVVAFVVLDCLLQYATGEDVFGRTPPVPLRLSGPFEETIPGSFLSQMAPPVIALGFGLAARARSNLTPMLAAAGAAALTGLTIALTGERAALIMYVFGLMILFLFLRPARKPLFVTALAGALSLGTVIATQPDLQERLIGHTTYDLSRFWERRIGSLVWRGQEIWHDHFLFGIGLKNFRRFCERDDFLPRGPVATRCYTHPHQIWNEWLAESGVIGFAGFVTLLVLWGRAIVRGLRLLEDDYALALGSLVSLVIILWPLRTSMSFFSNWTAAMVWLLLGLTLALTAPRGERPNPPS